MKHVDMLSWIAALSLWVGAAGASPPNQIIYVKPAQPILVKDMFNAYWVTGRMHVEIRNTQMASVSYTMSASKVEDYQ
jgi:hypothetical protein